MNFLETLTITAHDLQVSMVSKDKCKLEWLCRSTVGSAVIQKITVL